MPPGRPPSAPRSRRASCGSRRCRRGRPSRAGSPGTRSRRSAAAGDPRPGLRAITASITGASRCSLSRCELLVALRELGQHLAAEQLERFHDVLVAVLAGLEAEDHLVDAALLVAARGTRGSGRACRPRRAARRRPAPRPSRRAGPRSARRPAPLRGRSPARRGAPGTRPTRSCARAGAGRTRSSARASSRRSSRPRARGASLRLRRRGT